MVFFYWCFGFGFLLGGLCPTPVPAFAFFWLHNQNVKPWSGLILRRTYYLYLDQLKIKAKKFI